MELTNTAGLEPSEIVILAVPHRSYVEQGWALIGKLLGESGILVVDIKGALPSGECPAGLEYWRL